MRDDNEGLMMDVDALSFLGEEQQGRIGFAMSSGRDPVSDAPVFPLVVNGSNVDNWQDLRFKLGPTIRSNIAFGASKTLYPVQLPSVDMSDSFKNYVVKLFELYNGLGDNRIYSVPSIGVVNNSYRREHTMAVNLAFQMLTTGLQAFIESTQNYENSLLRLAELEEALTILNCLKTIHFTTDMCTTDPLKSDEDAQREALIQSLLDWVNRSDGEPSEESVEQVFDSSEKCFQDTDFWQLLNQLLLRGLFKQAVACIERSGILSHLEDQCQMSSDAMKDVIELLKHYSSDSCEDFREWKQLVLTLSHTYSSSQTSVSGDLRDNIEDTLLILSGDQAKILRSSKTWYESFCGFILYDMPSAQLFEEYLKLSLEANPVDVTNTWEQACVDIIQGRIYSILPSLEMLDVCTAAFAAGICDAKGLLEDYSVHEDILKEEILLEGIEDLFSKRNGMACYMLSNFALSLCSYDDKKIWSVAIGLIAILPLDTTSAKKIAIAELLPHYPFQTNDDIEWMLSVCAEWRLPAVARTIFTLIGTKLLYEKNTVEAISNFSKAGRFSWVKYYSWMVFEAAAIKGGPIDDVVLNAIVDNKDCTIPQEILENVVTAAMKQALSPYAVLYQFFQSQESPKEALGYLMALMEFTYLPKEYLALLMSKYLYPKLHDILDEDIILRIIELIEKRLDVHDSKSQKIYDTVKDKQLPSELAHFEVELRQRLNFQLCQEFMR